MSASEVFEKADELQDAMEETVSDMTGIRNRMKPVIDRVKGRRITEDDLWVCAQDADDLAGELMDLAEYLKRVAEEIERARFDDIEDMDDIL